MGVTQVELSPAASNDLLRIAARIADEFGDIHGKKFTNKILAEIKKIAEMPTRYMRLGTTQGGHSDYRRALVGKHRILFILSEDERTATVVRIEYQGVDPSSLRSLPQL